MTPLEKVKWMSEIARNHNLSDSAVRVGNILADCMNGQTGLCNPDQRYLSEQTNVSRRGVQMALKALSNSGHIRIISRGNGKGNSTEYELVKGAKSAPLKGAKNDPLSKPKGAKNDTQRAQKTTSKGAKNDIPPTPPYKEEPVKESVKGTSEGSEGGQKPLTLELAISPPPAAPATPPKPTALTWDAYATAYQQRYGVAPVRNATVNSQLAAFVRRLGQEEAPSVAAHYVTSNNAYYVRKGHAVGPMLTDAEKLRMEWATNRQTTSAQATQLDRTQSNANAAQDAIAILASRRESRNG